MKTTSNPNASARTSRLPITNSEQSKSDLRSTAQDRKRFTTAKAKWAHGAHPSAPGRDNNLYPRPARMSDKQTKDRDIASERKWGDVPLPGLSWSDEDEIEDGAEDINTEPEGEDQEVILKAQERPATGCSVLNAALNKAIVAFQDKETVRLVKSEWSILDDEGEEVGLSPVKKRGGKTIAAAPLVVEGEEDYEII